ncbi:RagB/SusD family nutrient uptake outer membrane protein [Flagellimonas taeanensis]|uniref:SusD family protein n=1 Tax=Flagellimonas taeanensis TaxID=1005926 RepID=A0A1M6WWI4_9FLAO|nr:MULTISPECIES: RagB/SusD family nutrient uptake outer membrane protein [Allomuricauda]MDC6386574.1 RagB/SusD family nutrient uptake outer membrane protein [Muricauda sp. SK9]MEE1964162.1 RagB/SusD family nutrient uptake outer membrane protein [Allomuricauda taeanensis]RIV51293.1 RagB/SusD family nutrient uptake outer membrane protein [Allomuricauda taeanensis]SFB99913.1 SusD family protein [Allomuricauda taeanensis]SHK97915.1 SusD family protein [Allomuricauda taeanensis]
MKRILYIMLCTVLFTGCSEDFTDLAPISNRNEADFYKSADDFEVAINASYRGLQSTGIYGRGYWTMFEMRSDNTDQGPDATGLARQYTEINAFTEDALNEQVSTAWSESYKVIANCNVILERISSVEMDASTRDRIAGEALFIRSLMYYHLAIAFGNVPLQLEPYVAGDELVQVSETVILEQMVTDLETAEGYLPVSYPSSSVGKATKGAAATLLAKVQLTLGNNTAAETVLRRIISSYGYDLVPEYADLWGVDNENNEESIFEVQFMSGGIGQGSLFTNDFSPSSALQAGAGYGRNRPTVSMQEAYEDGDSRYDASMGDSYINLDAEVVEALYIKKYQADIAIENDSDINFVVFRYADVLLMLAEALGETDESYDLINEVRERADLGEINAATPGTFEEKLLHERRVELAFENHRWADLRRFNAINKVIEAEPVITGTREYFFIPQREMDINPNFTQN